MGDRSEESQEIMKNFNVVEVTSLSHVCGHFRMCACTYAHMPICPYARSLPVITAVFGIAQASAGRCRHHFRARKSVDQRGRQSCAAWAVGV